MTDRIQAFVVILDRDMREDDADGLRQAILRLRGVADVVADVMDIDTVTTRARIRRETAEAFATMFRKIMDGETS